MDKPQIATEKIPSIASPVNGLSETTRNNWKSLIDWKSFSLSEAASPFSWKLSGKLKALEKPFVTYGNTPGEVFDIIIDMMLECAEEMDLDNPVDQVKTDPFGCFRKYISKFMK